MAVFYINNKCFVFFLYLVWIKYVEYNRWVLSWHSSVSYQLSSYVIQGGQHKNVNISRNDYLVHIIDKNRMGWRYEIKPVGVPYIVHEPTCFLSNNYSLCVQQQQQQTVATKLNIDVLKLNRLCQGSEVEVERRAAAEMSTYF